MKWLSIDARTDGFNQEFLGASWCDGDTAHYQKSWELTRAALAAYAVEGYRFVAHGAESVCMTLFMARREHFAGHYRNERWSYGQWFYGYDAPPVEIWDSFRLSGGLSIPDLAASQGVTPYPPPSALRHPTVDPDGLPCWDHKVINCPRCFSEANRYAWVCDEHTRGECMECWQTQAVKIVHHYMGSYTGLLAGYGIAPKRSLSTAALAIWRTLDNPDPIKIRDQRADALAREGYAGGRVEPYKLGQLHDVYYADVHMMYAAIMRDVRMPDPRSTEYNGSEHLDDRFIQYEGVSDATVTIPSLHVGPLPVRAHDALQFPVGRVRAVFTHVELRAAIQRGCVLERVHATAYSTETVAAFTGYAEGFINWREELRSKNNPTELVIKMLLNQLPGRIGLTGEQTRLYVMPLPPGTTDRDWPDWEMKIKRDTILMRRQTIRHIVDKWANPLWAATITGYARVKLLELMERQGGNLAYVDTDSIISTEPIIGMGTGPGELEDGGMYADCLIVAPKMYSLTTGVGQDRYRASGVPKRMAERYLKMRRAQWSEPAGLLDAWDSNLYPGELRVITEERRLGPSKRHPLNPVALYEQGSYTDTIPITHSYLEA